MSDSKESVGFLCRWALAPVLGILLLGGGWFCMTAAASAKGELNSYLVVPDFARKPGVEPRELMTYAGPAVAVARMALWRVDQGCLNFATVAGYDTHCPLWFGDPSQVGQRRVEVFGNPYTSLAFARAVRILRLARPTRLFLVDARTLCREMGNGEVGRCRQLLQILKSRGEVLLFHASSEDLREIQSVIRTAGFREPLLCEANTANPTRLFERMGSDMQLKPSQVVVVTGQEDLAGKLKERQFTVCLVSSAPCQPSLVADHFPSFAILKDWLLNQPISN